MTNLQKSYKEDLMVYITTIEAAMTKTVDQTNGENISCVLNERVSLLSICPRMMGLAVLLYDEMKGEVALEAMLNENLIKAKDSLQRLYLQGKLAEWNALYVRSERCQKDLDKSIEGLRSLLSYDKSMKQL